MMGDIVIREVTDLTWEKTVENSTQPVIVMFYSSTCPHCKAMEPYFAEYAAEFKDSMFFIKANVAQNPWAGERYGVRATPTFRFFCLGKPIREMVGAVYPVMLRKAILEVLEGGDECARNSTEINYEVSGYA